MLKPSIDGQAPWMRGSSPRMTTNNVISPACRPQRKQVSGMRSPVRAKIAALANSTFFIGPPPEGFRYNE